MSVLIKGIDVPKSCALCFYRDNFHDYCPYEANKERDCPLVEVPTPHGRLIDADVFDRHMKQTPRYFSMCCDLEEQPTIIEAEEGDKGC